MPKVWGEKTAQIPDAIPTKGNRMGFYTRTVTMHDLCGALARMGVWRAEIRINMNLLEVKVPRVPSRSSIAGHLHHIPSGIQVVFIKDPNPTRFLYKWKKYNYRIDDRLFPLHPRQRVIAIEKAPNRSTKHQHKVALDPNATKVHINPFI